MRPMQAQLKRPTRRTMEAYSEWKLVPATHMQRDLDRGPSRTSQPPSTIRERRRYQHPIRKRQLHRLLSLHPFLSKAEGPPRLLLLLLLPLLRSINQARPFPRRSSARHLLHRTMDSSFPPSARPIRPPRQPRRQAALAKAHLPLVIPPVVTKPLPPQLLEAHRLRDQPPPSVRQRRRPRSRANEARLLLLRRPLAARAACPRSAPHSQRLRAKQVPLLLDLLPQRLSPLFHRLLSPPPRPPAPFPTFSAKIVTAHRHQTMLLVPPLHLGWR